MKTNNKRSIIIPLMFAVVVILVACTFTACNKNPEKEILGKWYNEDGDCLEIFSDNTYSIDIQSDICYDIGMDKDTWTYLEEEDYFKFYTDTYSGDVKTVKITTDQTGTYIKYSYFGTFYKK